MKNKIQSIYPQLFFILCCIFWILIVMKLGVYDSSITPKSGVLPFTFNWWESTSFRNHLFLGNYLENETANGTVYTTYTYPFYFVNYIILAPIHFIFHISYEKAQNILPYINVLFFAGVIYRLKREEIKTIILTKNIYFQGSIFLIIGLLISNSLPWTSMLRNNLENFHMFIAVLFCILSLVCIKQYETAKKDRLFLTIGLLISFITPIYFPAWILCYIYTEGELKIRKKMLWTVTIVILSNVINNLIPTLAAESLHLKSSASGYLYRSGLDGSNTYFDSILSVFYAPKSQQQTISTLLLIGSVIVLGRVLKEKSKVYFKQFIFLLIPIFTTVTLFPQFSSIHMYFIELLIVIPCIFMLCYWLLNFELITRLKANQYSMTIVFFSFLIMSQLLEVARHFCLLSTLKNIFNQ